jgi:hypothetical protein
MDKRRFKQIYQKCNFHLGLSVEKISLLLILKPGPSRPFYLQPGLSRTSATFLLNQHNCRSLLKRDSQQSFIQAGASSGCINP